LNTFNAIHDKIPDSTAPQKKALYDHAGGFKIQSIALREGGVIPPCTMSRDVMFYIINGSGQITVDSETQALHAGDGCVVPASCGSRSISAQTDMTILAVQSGSESKEN
jgi:mannose-6-phosphate isomerase-like protein (cupin superfamily)